MAKLYSVQVTVNSKEETLKAFVRVSSKNLASSVANDKSYVVASQLGPLSCYAELRHAISD
jgi:hypothetical protein